MAALRAGLDAGRAILDRGGPALDAVTAAVEALEGSGQFNAGRGAVRDAAGGVSLDAAVMDGSSRRAGAVAGLIGFGGAVRVARLVLDRTQHVLLVGPGAEAFATSAGLARVPDSYFDARHRVSADAVPTSQGTVGAVALDASGHLAAATSTGGVTGKLPGRVGDSPIIGAGTYADGRCAVSATGAGEAFIRAVFAYRLAAAHAAGAAIADASQQSLTEVAALGGSGGCIALDSMGNVAMPFDTPGMFRAMSDGPGRRLGAIFKEPLQEI